MLEVRASLGNAKKLPAVVPETANNIELQRLADAPAVQLIARDAFVSDIAVKLDQLQIEIKALARDLAASKHNISELRDDVGRAQRFSSFQESGQRVCAEKLDEVTRRFRDLKMRIDKIDGKCDGNYHAYNSLEAVSVKLTELSEMQREFRHVDRRLRWSAGLFCGSVLLWLLAVLF